MTKADRLARRAEREEKLRVFELRERNICLYNCPTPHIKCRGECKFYWSERAKIRMDLNLNRRGARCR